MSNFVTNVTGGEGNTKTSPPRFRRVCFTLNNYLEEDVVTLSQYFEKIDANYIMGKEVGTECGTKHIQGYVEFKKMVRFTTLKKIDDRIHWEKAIGDREANIKYCSKEGDFKSTFTVDRRTRLLQKYDTVIWKGWQQDVIDIIQSEPDSRTIYWFWEPTGNVGKSFLCKYLDLKYDAIIGEGKSADIFNQVKMWCDANENIDPRVILLDVPRYSLGYINYGAIEKLKNGHIYSGKYEGGKIAFECPHVIVFANSEPDTHFLSEDRWSIIKITK